MLPAFGAVCCFFTLSGYVLATTYKGHPGTFMIRRLIRLWPLYAVCITVGGAIIGTLPTAADYLWLSIPDWGQCPAADRPAWSLYYEVWATPFFPALIWLNSRSRIAGWCLAIAIILLGGTVDFRLALTSFFAIGVALAQYGIKMPAKFPKWLVWLGQVSFSLYLTHQLIFTVAVKMMGSWGVVVVLPMLPLVAAATWRLIEQPSTRLERIFGRIGNQFGSEWIPGMVVAENANRGLPWNPHIWKPEKH